MSEACAKRDLVQNSQAMFLLWGVPPVIMLLSVCWVGGGWIVTLTWTLSLAVMGGACLVNARGCGRMHCYFTGPFFLLLAVASLLYGLRVLPVDRKFKPPVRTKPCPPTTDATDARNRPYVEPKLRGRAPCRENRALPYASAWGPGR
jgi:hypothetical protein